MGIAVAFVVFICIEVATIGNGPKKEVEAYKKSLIAQGEKLEISELIPPPVPVEQNGADLVNQALGMLTQEDNEDTNFVPAATLVAPGKAMICFEQPDIRGVYFTNSWSNETAIVDDDRPMIELLTQASDYPALDFRLDYRQAFSVGAYILPLMYCVHRLSAAAVCDLHQGNVAAAVKNICVVLALVNGQQNCMQPYAQMLRVSMARSTADTTWELLQSRSLNDAELALVQSNWESLEFIRAMVNALSMERAGYDSEITKMETSSQYFGQEMSGFAPFESPDWSDGLGDVLHVLSDDAKLVFVRSAYKTSWIYSDELGMLQNDQLVLETIREAATNQFFNPAYSNMLNQLRVRVAGKPDGLMIKLNSHEFYHFFSESSPYSAYVREIMTAEATCRVTATGVALKRYQLKHGKYPATLSDLVPEFISSIPRDPVDGKPLRYRLMADGSFLLYSIGENGRDDGGDGSTGRKSGRNFPSRWTERAALDWVWPQPATAAEIKYFYAHRSKP